MPEIKAVHFPAEIIKVQTMQDMAIRVTFDLPEGCTDMAMWLMEAKRRGATLEIAAVPIEQIINPVKQKENSLAKVPTRSEWKSEGPSEEGPRPNSDT